ncbi:hypothetical protein ACFWVP_03985 [Streptomyces sp. NPDC058637]|uniref:hypothetical protein n=1 Tax=Streptomyces sp. NPDC058637 TaxID=3346569 RepID=UPI003668581A
MPREQVLIAIVLVAVPAWSAVMAALGRIAAVATPVPSFELVVQQIVHAARSDSGPTCIDPPAAGRDEGHVR